jgi:hypothetical protein
VAEQLQDVTAQANLWVSKTRSAVKREVQALLSKVDHAEIEHAAVRARVEHSWRNFQALQDKRMSLLDAMGKMAPKTELQHAQAKCASLAADVERLSAQDLQRQREIDGLTVRMQGAQTEVDKLLKMLQVGALVFILLSRNACPDNIHSFFPSLPISCRAWFNAPS